MEFLGGVTIFTLQTFRKIVMTAAAKKRRLTHKKKIPPFPRRRFWGLLQISTFHKYGGHNHNNHFWARKKFLTPLISEFSLPSQGNGMEISHIVAKVKFFRSPTVSSHITFSQETHSSEKSSWRCYSVEVCSTSLNGFGDGRDQKSMQEEFAVCYPIIDYYMDSQSATPVSWLFA